MPLVSRTFDQLIDFSRTSAATYVDATGKIVTTPASRNLLTYTQEFDNAAWGRYNANLTTNDAMAPDGTMTADTLVSTTTDPYVVQIVSNTALTYTVSVWLKGIGSSIGKMPKLYLVRGSYLEVVSSTTLPVLTDQWQRYTYTGTFTVAPSTVQVRIDVIDNSVITGESVNIWGAQLELGSTASTYTRNVAGTFPPRFDYDPVTLAPKGLLIEEQRTNFVLYSADFTQAAWQKLISGAGVLPVVTPNYGTAPDGSNTATRLQLNAGPNGGSDYSLLRQSGLGSGGIVSRSIWAKSNTGTDQVVAFVATNSSTKVTITPTWQRIILPNTSSAGAQQFDISVGGAALTPATADISVWGAQFEEGAFATSYIPTVASQVTRTADFANIVAPNFAPWHNQSEGTFVVSGSGRIGASGSAVLLATLTSGANNLSPQIDMTTATNTRSVYTDAAGNIVSNIAVTVASTSAINNYAAAFSSAGTAIVANGGAVTTGSITSLPAPSAIHIGRVASQQFLNGHLRSIRYYPTRLTNAQLQALTA